MKRLILAFALATFAAAPANAALKTIGKGDSLRFDPNSIPANMKPSFKIMEVKCVKCHTLERTVVAIQTGIAPISGQPFDRAATKAYGVKMLRKPDSNMNKQEVKAVVDLMNYLLDEAGK
jgi:hypothetical protein